MQETRKNLALTLLLSLFIFTFPILEVADAEIEDQSSNPENVGPYTVGWIQVNISKNGGEQLPIIVFYPAVIDGEESDPNSTDAPYPAVLFSPGYRSPIENYRALGLKIASWGFITALVGSNLESWDIDRVNDLEGALNWLDEQNDNSSFKLHQLIDESKFIVSGHSLGAEAALILSISEHRLKAVIPIAPFIYPPWTFMYPSSAKDIHIPMLILVGSADTISPPSTMAYPIYENGNVPKFCLTIIGSDHFTIIFTCTKYIISFLKFYFHNEQEYARYLYGFEAQQEALNGKIDLKYDLRTTFEYEIIFKGISCEIHVYSDSTFLDLTFNESLMEMTFRVFGPPHTVGTANISIPKAPLEEYTIKAYFDGELYSFTLTNSSTLDFVYLCYNHSLHELKLCFVDLTPPTLLIFSPKENSVLPSSTVVVAWISKDAASGLNYFEVKVDEGPWLRVENAMAYEFENLNDGNHTAYVKAYDFAGNVKEARINFKIDTIPPAVSLLSPDACSTLNSSNITITWVGTDYIAGIERYEVKLDNDPWINVGTNETYTLYNLANGKHELYIKAIDKAGNVFEMQVSFNVDANYGTDFLPLTIISIIILCLAFPIALYIAKKVKLHRKNF
ncbi:MAG: hypothetical protein QXJ53_01345 [Candidatus Bathyarchaeia archaeon]